MGSNDKVAGQAQELAERVSDTIYACLPGGPIIAALKVPGDRVQLTAVEVDQSGVALDRPAEMPLFVAGELVAYWNVSILLGLDYSGVFLKTMKSAISMRSVWEKNPLVRLEYDSAMTTAPIAHWQFHAERGAFSHLLARAAAGSKYVTEHPHSLSKLHFPAGGERFRPSLEDFIEFLIRECGVDSTDGWQRGVQDGRELWRRMQARAVARDLQAETAQILREQGWVVEPPTEWDEWEKVATLRGW